MRLKKRLGQNLLLDKNIHRKLLAAMKIEHEDIVIEIGPGLGAVTESILAQSCHCVGIEIDERFCGELNRKFGHNPNFELINGDFLKVDLDALIADLRRRLPDAKSVVVFGNLPYYITTPIITRLIEQRTWDRAFLTVQLEVAERLIACPGSKVYGAITLFINYYLSVKKLFKIPATVFLPRPRVDSAFLHLTPLPAPAVQVPDEELLFNIIRTAFSKRRKMLSNSLQYLRVSGLTGQKLFETIAECGINMSSRPEQLSLDDFAVLTNAVYRAMRAPKQK